MKHPVFHKQANTQNMTAFSIHPEQNATPVIDVLCSVVT